MDTPQKQDTALRGRELAEAHLHQELRDRARAEHGSDVLQIDADADVSLADDGAWVAAWVWVGGDDE